MSIVRIFIKDQAKGFLKQCVSWLKAEKKHRKYPKKGLKVSNKEKIDQIIGKNKLFFREFKKHPKHVGNIASSSRASARFICDQIDFSSAKCIVEYGAGTGAFTEEILDRVLPSTIVLIFELNKQFYEYLCKRVEKRGLSSSTNIHIINDSVENIEFYLEQKGVSGNVDYVVSALPFASLPKSLGDSVLSKTKDLLGDGSFFAIQYTSVSDKLFHFHFNHVEVNYQFFNLPPVFIYECRNI